jgi:outer membrane protein OmpA-like peptidoglycan-associated protein
MKKKILTTILSSLLLTSVFAAETFAAEILVTDFDEVPVSEMDVLLFNDKGTLVHSGNTGSKGSFDLILSPGSYTIQLKEEGEIKKEAPLNIPELEGRKIYNHVRIQVLYEAREKFEIENLNFETNSAEILKDSYEALDKLVLFLKSESTSKFSIEGHTDSDGSEKSNEELSRARAEAVKAYLVMQGIKAEQLDTVGKGESNPIANNSTAEGKAINRRTEIRKITD